MALLQWRSRQRRFLATLAVEFDACDERHTLVVHACRQPRAIVFDHEDARGGGNEGVSDGKESRVAGDDEWSA
jgi:hypothetical protein